MVRYSFHAAFLRLHENWVQEGCEIMRYFRSIVSLVLVICFITLIPCMVYAGIGAKPFFQELEGQVGEKLEGVYSVYNTGDTPLEVEVYLKDHFRSEENKDISAGDWLSCEQMEFTLGPEETKDIKFVAQVPEGAVGEIMGMIFFSAASSTGSNIKMSYGVPVYVKIKDSAIVKGSIKDIKIKKMIEAPKGISPYYQASVLVENEGNVHLRPTILIKLYRDKEFVKTVLFPFGKPVFPSGSHNYMSTWKVEEFEIPSGDYIAEAEVSFYEEILKKKTGFAVDKDGNIKMHKEGDSND